MLWIFYSFVGIFMAENSKINSAYKQKEATIFPEPLPKTEVQMCIFCLLKVH